jgi:O-antigen/teichoic acid export membrane protein
VIGARRGYGGPGSMNPLLILGLILLLYAWLRGALVSPVQRAAQDPLGFVAFVVATPLLVFLFGGPYAAATPAFRILCTGLPVVFAIWILHAVAISVDRERLLLQTGIIGLAVNVGLNLYVIPHYGPVGAAAATVVGEVVSMTVLLAGLRSRA